MTLNKAITDLETKYKSDYNLQLADWLSDYKRLLEQQPKYNTSEWCHDCSEYNHEKHCCPRYNKVIRTAVEEMKQTKTGHWIPVSERLPEESIPVLVQAEEIYYTDSYTKGIIIGWRDKMGWHTITNKGGEAIHYPIAWMPLPEVFEPQESEETDERG